MRAQPDFDYIIAGAGSSGCALAARLCEDADVRVCLLEAGGNADSLFVRMPAANGFIFGHHKYDWCYQSTAQAGLGGRKIYYPRGKGLGGTSLLNGLIYIRGNSRDYDRWQAKGINGWGYEQVLPYFKRAESAPYRDPQYHGHSGPLKLSPAVNFSKIDEAFIAAAQQAGALPNPDFNAASQLGVGRFDTKVFNGKRQSSSSTYLQQRPANLTILTHTRVLKIEFSGMRASGVRIESGGKKTSLRANREVICCLGAFASPQLLMLSGIGPARHLGEVGIKPLVDLAGVGESLQDHPNMPLTYGLRDRALSFSRYQRIDRAIWLGLQYFLLKSGPATGPFWSTALFHALDGGALPDIEVFCTPMLVREEYGGAGWNIQNLINPGRAILARGKTAAAGVQFDINLLRPKSLGRVRLASSNPADHPLIDPGYLSDGADLYSMIEALAHMREVAAQPALAQILAKELTPGPAVVKKEQITQALRRQLTTGHHPVSTCRMGAEADELAVLDAEFRVRGVEQLRVVDASAFPDQISGNPNAAIMMMAERAADMLLGRAQLQPATAPAS